MCGLNTPKLTSLSIRLFGEGGGGGGGEEEERKGKREEKPDTKALRRGALSIRPKIPE